MIKDFNKGDSYLTKENKVTLAEKKNQNGYEVYVARVENLNQEEVQIVDSMPNDEVAKVDSVAEEQKKNPWWKFWKGDKV